MPAFASRGADKMSVAGSAKAWLVSGSGSRVHVQEIEGRGRCIIATHDLEPGSVAFACAPAAVAPLGGPVWIGRCQRCMNASSNLLRCSRCHMATYCSKECQARDWSHGHKRECEHLPWLTKEVHGSDAVSLLLLRRLLSHESLRDASTPAEPGVYVHTWEDVALMQSDTRGRLDSRFRSLLALGVDRGLLPATTDTEQALLNAFDCNNFSVVDELMMQRAAGVYPLGALLNHSCCPNAVMQYLSAADAATQLAQEGLPVQALKTIDPDTPIQVVRILSHVRAGTELCHSYVDIALPTAARQDHLQDAYSFTCTCALCTAGPDDKLNHDRFLISTADCAGRAVVGVPVADHVGDKVTSSDDRVLNEYGTLPKEAAVDIKVAQQLMARADLAAGKPEVLAKLSGPGLGEKEGDDVRISFSVGNRGMEVEDVLSTLKELRVIEGAMSRLRKQLHPFHVLTIQAVNSCMTRALLLADMPTAAAACEHAVAWLRAAYGHLSHHPMLSLQLYSLADILFEMPAFPRAAMTAARADELQRLFVRSPRIGFADEAAHADAAGATYIPAAWPVLKGASKEEGNAREAMWLRFSLHTYRECLAGLTVTHGKAHQMTTGVAERIAEIETQLASSST